MLKSLQWKIVLIYSLLLLFTLQLIGVYLVQDLERYYLESYKENLENQAKLLSTFISPRPLEERSAEDIAYLIKEFRGLWEMDIMVLDSNARVVGSSGSQDIIGSRLIRQEVTAALSSATSGAIRIDPSTRERRYYLAVPLASRGSTVGLIYLSGSLNSVDRTLNQIKLTLITGSGIALAIGLCLGLILTRTITSPILEVTRKAHKMAQGDFSQHIQVVSADEIGQLGRSFNYLSSRLSQNLNEISAEKSKVEAIINYMNDGVIALDPQGSVIHINPAARKIISAWPGNQLNLGDSGVQMLKRFAGPQAAGVMGNQGEPANFEVIRERPPGIFQVQLAPFQQEKGHAGGTLVVIHDISKERELIRLQQEFVADVSHELRTPLTTIKSYVEALLDGATGDQELGHRFLKVLEKETNRMVRLVKDLLVLSLLDSRQVELHKTRVSLPDLIQEAADYIQQRQENLPEILFDFPGQLPPVEVDRGRVMQVVTNIISNAVNYTSPEGFVRVEILLQPGFLKVVIADNGIGIPNEDLPRIFERFYRVEKDRSRDYGGTGLGLSIARKIVEAHGGEIGVDSIPGEGTTVWFAFPV